MEVDCELVRELLSVTVRASPQAVKLVIARVSMEADPLVPAVMFGWAPVNVLEAAPGQERAHE
jgi:hypothetical protein